MRQARCSRSPWQFLALVLVFSACSGGTENNACRTVLPSTEPCREVLFQDGFDADSLGRDWQVISGDWQIQAGELHGVVTERTSSDTPVWAVLTLNRTLPADYTVSLRTRIQEGEVSELMVHLSNNRYVRAYLYEIDQAVMLGNGRFLSENRPGQEGLDEVLGHLGGGPTVLQHAVPIVRDRWYHVRVSISGNRYRISVGGQELVDHTDTAGELSPTGTIGLISNGHMAFDDIAVWTEP